MTTDESVVLHEMRVDVAALRIDMDKGLLKLERFDETLFGDDKGGLGIVQMVKFMWKTFWLWPLCTASGIIGVVGTIVFQKLFR